MLLKGTLILNIEPIHVALREKSPKLRWAAFSVNCSIAARTVTQKRACKYSERNSRLSSQFFIFVFGFIFNSGNSIRYQMAKILLKMVKIGNQSALLALKSTHPMFVVTMF